jgi:hypothetical protein
MVENRTISADVNNHWGLPGLSKGLNMLWLLSLFYAVLLFIQRKYWRPSLKCRCCMKNPRISCSANLVLQSTLKYLFVETESLWSQESVTRDFWKSCSIRPRYLIFKHFSVGSASDEIVTAYSQQSLKSCPRMLSQRILEVLKNTQQKQNKMQFMTKNNHIWKIWSKWTF